MITVHPVYSNKWKFYMYGKDECEFNWFSCGTPYIHGENRVIKIGPHTLLFDVKTGYTYHVTFDAAEKDVLLKIVENSPSKKDFKKAVREGYAGIAYKEPREETRDLICNQVTLIFDKRVLEKSKTCPYITFAKSHGLKSTNSLEIREKVFNSYT